MSVEMQDFMRGDIFKTYNEAINRHKEQLGMSSNTKTRNAIPPEAPAAPVTSETSIHERPTLAPGHFKPMTFVFADENEPEVADDATITWSFVELPTQAQTQRAKRRAELAEDIQDTLTDVLCAIRRLTGSIQRFPTEVDKSAPECIFSLIETAQALHSLLLEEDVEQRDREQK